MPGSGSLPKWVGYAWSQVPSKGGVDMSRGGVGRWDGYIQGMSVWDGCVQRWGWLGRYAHRHLCTHPSPSTDT